MFSQSWHAEFLQSLKTPVLGFCSKRKDCILRIACFQEANIRSMEFGGKSVRLDVAAVDPASYKVSVLRRIMPDLAPAVTYGLLLLRF